MYGLDRKMRSSQQAGNAMIDSLMESMVRQRLREKRAQVYCADCLAQGPPARSHGSPGRHGRTGGPGGLHGRWLPLWRHRSRLPLVARNARWWTSRAGGGEVAEIERVPDGCRGVEQAPRACYYPAPRGVFMSGLPPARIPPGGGWDRPVAHRPSPPTRESRPKRKKHA